MFGACMLLVLYLEADLCTCHAHRRHNPEDSLSALGYAGAEEMVLYTPS